MWCFPRYFSSKSPTALGSRLQMAIRCSSFNVAIPWKPKKPSSTSKSSTLCNCHDQLEVASTPGRKLGLSKKVFEDGEIGILCYVVDGTGELVCEGYDEGPRLAAKPLKGFKRQRWAMDKGAITIQAQEYNNPVVRQRLHISDFIN